MENVLPTYLMVFTNWPI